METALDLAEGLLVAEIADKKADTEEPTRHLMSAKFACPVSGFTIEEIEPRLFSFNNPFGACPSCDGLGKKLYFNPDLVVPDTTKTIRDGALTAWANKANNPSPFYFQALEAVANHFSVSLDTPWQDLPKKAQDAFLYGTGKTSIAIVYADGKRRFEVNKPFEGVLNNIERRWRETDSNWMREELSKYQSSTKCTACDGARLKPEALAVKIDGWPVSKVTDLSIKEAHQWFLDLPQKLNTKQQAIAEKVLKEIQDRLNFLMNVGLEYLSLSRSSGTLSGGESQRIRLASQIGSGLTGVLYVLDEPSIGLHQRDNDRLLETLQNLRDIGNTVLVVEHDEDAIR
ncbi:MAG: hypothetical protein MI743_00090, partial [Sneathiellales bacterium]|nr:hypothetical protein [Sneathiellales bacterium]